MNWIQLVTFASVLCAAVVTAKSHARRYAKILWSGRAGYYPAQEDIEFVRPTEFKKYRCLLEDALDVVKPDHSKPKAILMVWKAPRPPSPDDLAPNVPKLKPVQYLVAFLAENSTKGVHMLCFGETENGRGWSNSRPRFYKIPHSLMKATHKDLREGKYKGLTDGWNLYVSKFPAPPSS